MTRTIENPRNCFISHRAIGNFCRLSKIFFAIAISLPILTLPARGDTTTVYHDSFANQPIGRSPATSQPTSGKTPAIRAPDVGFMQVVLALGAVVALILILRAMIQRTLPQNRLGASSSAMRVVSRCSISPKQNLLLVKIGQRLILVGDSGAQLNQLCEIRDEAEVQALLGKVQEESISAAKRFESLFGRAKRVFTQSDEEPQTLDDATSADLAEIEDAPAPEDSRGDLDSETERDVASSEPPVTAREDRFDASNEISDSAVANTQHQLSDLSEKLRDLSRKLRANEKT